MTNLVYYTLLGFATGLITGAVFYGGLWLTVKKGLTAQKPALLFLGSFVLRTALVLIGFYYLSLSGIWQSLLAALVGFILIRLVITRLTGRLTMQILENKEVSHES